MRELAVVQVLELTLLPPVYNLEHLDGHPNADGIGFYGDLVSSAVAERRLIKSLARAN